MIFPLVRDLEEVHPTNARVDAHSDDPAFGYRFLADKLEHASLRVGERRVWRLWSTTVRKGRHAQRPNRRRRRSGRPRSPAASASAHSSWS